MRRLLQTHDASTLDRPNPASANERVSGLRTITGRLVVHPFLFAVYPILVMCAQNAGEVRTREQFGLIGAAFLASLACWLVLWLAMRDAKKAGLITTLAVAMFASFSLIHEYCEILAIKASAFWVKDSFNVHPMALILLEVLLLAGLARLLVVKFKDARGATSFLNLFAIFLAIFPVSILLLVKAPTLGRPARHVVPFDLASKSEAPPQSDRLPMPDIYYIILDGYARSDVMKDLFQFDNEPFLRRLEEKGFYIARRSTSNYCQTPLSLSSSLNGEYLDDLVKGLGADQTELRDLIGKNNIVATLRPLGYKFISFGTGFDPTEIPDADVYSANSPYFSAFQRMLVDATPLRVLWPGPDIRKNSARVRERIPYVLEHLAEIARDKAPTFTFAHLLSPHPPFVFGENGEDVGYRYFTFEFANRDKIRGRFRDPALFAEGYRKQSVFITRRIEETIDRILATSPQPPIIILQSDHGSELNLDPESAQHTDLKERMSILNAYLFPGKRYAGLYDSISPVNSFRVLLNTFFGAHVKLLPDRSFYSTWSEPYKFIDVTDAVRPSLPEKR